MAEEGWQDPVRGNRETAERNVELVEQIDLDGAQHATDFVQNVVGAFRDTDMSDPSSQHTALQSLLQHLLQPDEVY